MTAANVGAKLNSHLADADLEPLDSELAARFADYLALMQRWNRRFNLTSIRDEDGILRRHFVESIAVARALPDRIHTLLDFGSGAGLPGIPIALCRPEIEVTLAESQGKKAAFLHEALRVLGLGAKVYSGRAEALLESFDCVTLRAVDRMGYAVLSGGRLVKPGGWLALMTTSGGLKQLENAAGEHFRWERNVILVPGNSDRILALGLRSGIAINEPK